MERGGDEFPKKKKKSTGTIQNLAMKNVKKNYQRKLKRKDSEVGRKQEYMGT